MEKTVHAIFKFVVVMISRSSGLPDDMAFLMLMFLHDLVPIQDQNHLSTWPIITNLKQINLIHFLNDNTKMFS